MAGMVTKQMNERMMRWLGPQSPNFRGVTDYDVWFRLAVGYWMNCRWGLGAARQPRVDFCIAGAEKCGTTALAGQLSHHPDIRLPLRKEPRYFVDHRFFAGQADGDEDWYHRQFWWRNDNKIITGDTSPQYLMHPRAPERIAAYNPGMRVVCLLRPHLDRMFSYWKMVKRNGTKMSWEEFESRAASGPDWWRYGNAIRRWQRLFPPEQLLFLPYQAFRDHPEDTLNQVLAFINLSPVPEPFVPIRRNTSSALNSDITMPPEETAWMVEDMADVEVLLGWSPELWRRR